MSSVFKSWLKEKVNVKNIVGLVNENLEKNNIKNISFEYVNKKNLYNFIDKKIYISETLTKTEDYNKINNLLNNSKDTVEIIILHEVSHAIHHQNMYEENYNNFKGFINLQTKFDLHLLSEIPATIKNNYNKAQRDLESF